MSSIEEMQDKWKSKRHRTDMFEILLYILFYPVFHLILPVLSHIIKSLYKHNIQLLSSILFYK